MRSIDPIPGDPWPHDMLIRIDVHSHLLTLLFIREAWDIARDADVPELDPAPEIGVSAIPAGPSKEQWTERWTQQWQRAWAWFDIEDMRSVPQNPELLRSLKSGQEFSPWYPPTWMSEHGDQGIDRDALWRWEQSIVDDHSAPFAEHPERRNLDVLIPAWRAGVDSIIVLPYHGYFAQRIGHRHFAVSKATRDDPVLYDLALSTVN